MLAKALAKQAAAVFLPIPASVIDCKWVGESNNMIAAAFSLAEKIKPAVILVDEIDTFFSPSFDNSQSASAVHAEKVKSEFLALVDGISTKENAGIIVMGATNRPDRLEPALLRRLPIQCEIAFPNREDRLRILESILHGEEKVSQEVRGYLPILANKTNGYSGSDLKELCTEAAYVRIRELTGRLAEYKTKNRAARDDEEPEPTIPDHESLRDISKQDFDLALGKVKKTGQIALGGCVLNHMGTEAIPDQEFA